MLCPYGLAVRGATTDGSPLTSLSDTYRQRWTAADWHPSTSKEGTTTTSSATTSSGNAVDLLVGGDRGGLVVRTPCVVPAVLPPLSTTADAVLSVEMPAVELAGAVHDSADAPTSDKAACGPGYQQTIVDIGGAPEGPRSQLVSCQ